jgi:hypothetical protein
MHEQRVERDRLRDDQDVLAVVVRVRRRSEGRRREKLRVGLGNAARGAVVDRASPAPSDRSGQQPANVRRRQLAPPMRSWFAAQPWSRNYGQAPGASKTIRERLIATRDRSRLGAVAADSGAVLRRSSSRRRVGLVGERLDERLHVPGCPGDLETLRATRCIRDRVCGRTYRRRQRADVMSRATDPVGGPDAPIRHRRARH